MERDLYQNNLKKIKNYIQLNGWRKLSIYIFIFSIILYFFLAIVTDYFWGEYLSDRTYSNWLKMRIADYIGKFFLILAILSVIINLFSKSKKIK
tara:strand:+ start:242 stop:523 length:282 start_codon:yes stop_codon:yes gene_type:complete